MIRYIAKKIRNYFIAGIIVIFPLFVSIYLVWRIFNWLDSLVGEPFVLVPWDRPGAGIISAIIIIFLTGVLTANLVGKKIVELTDVLFTRLPLIRNIYLAIKQLTDTFAQNDRPSFNRVLMVEYPRKGVWALGFATGESKGEPQVKTKQKLLSIFIPTTPNPTSGMLIMAPREHVIFLDMTVEEGLKFVMSGGVVAPPVKEDNGQELAPQDFSANTALDQMDNQDRKIPLSGSEEKNNDQSQ